MSSNNKNIVLVGLLVAIVGLGGIWGYIKYRSVSSSPVSDLGLVSYVNAQGQEWSIPKGEYKFDVSSANRYPKFITGFINPLDVKVGDIQKMMVAINNDTSIKRVWAEVETDNSTKMVELKLEATSTISVASLKSSSYLVDKDGTLVINDGSAKFSDVLEKLVNTADAASIVQYQYSGEWVVEDTHTKTYHTRFVVEDKSGRGDSMTLAWSDPVCIFGPSGVLSDSCSTSLGVEGYDNGDISIDINKTITLSAGTAVLAFNPGKKVSLSGGGKVLIGAGSKIQQAYICIVDDNDGDGWPSDITRVTNSQSSCSNLGASYKRLYTIATSTLDCDPYNGNVFQGQGASFTTAIADSGGTSAYNGTYDYNCNGTVVQLYSPHLGKDTKGAGPAYCYWAGSASGCLSSNNAPATGWNYDWNGTRTTIPACGNANFGGVAKSFAQNPGSACSSYSFDSNICNTAGITNLVQACN
jgi:hypothetical protein